MIFVPFNNFWFDPTRLSQAFCAPLPPNVVDFLYVVGALYAADRISPRTYGRVDTGLRRIPVRVGVSNLALWNDPRVAQQLSDLLEWLSGDVWSIEFVKRQDELALAGQPRFLFTLPPQQPVTVSLFSGGLDSLAGLANHIQSTGTHILVSGYTHDRLAYHQRAQVSRIRLKLGELFGGNGPEVLHVAARFGIRKQSDRREEGSQRTRALVYLALGVSAALQAHTDTLWVYENGVGALNLPINGTQLGIDNYRGVHPRSLMMAEDLFSLILDQPIRIRNPFLFTTKAQMCKALELAGLLDVIRDTVSCDGFPQRVHDAPSQCGHCTSCVLRRQALSASGLVEYDPPRMYRHDITSEHVRRADHTLYGVDAMRGQVHVLARCLASEDPWASLAAGFPELARTRMDILRYQGIPDPASHFVRLYQTYVKEWESFTARAETAA